MATPDAPTLELLATRLSDVPTPPAGGAIVRWGVGPRLRPVCLMREPGPAGTFIHHLWRLTATGPEVLVLPPTSEEFSLAQPLGAGDWLLVRVRAQGDQDPNASVYAADGTRLRSFHIGDGVQDVQCSAERTLWVSYFDEGIYSGHELASLGLVAFDATGHVKFRFDSVLDLHPDLPPIDDCYALNVVSDADVWLSYYSDFPLVRLLDGGLGMAWLRQPVKGAHALAVAGDFVLFAGGFAGHETLRLLKLNTREPRAVRALDATGQPLGFQVAVGRGSTLTLFGPAGIFRLDLAGRSDSTGN